MFVPNFKRYADYNNTTDNWGFFGKQFDLILMKKKPHFHCVVKIYGVIYVLFTSLILTVLKEFKHTKKHITTVDCTCIQ